jgi:hypothetical protein
MINVIIAAEWGFPLHVSPIFALLSNIACPLEFSEHRLWAKSLSKESLACVDESANYSTIIYVSEFSLYSLAHT